MGLTTDRGQGHVSRLTDLLRQVERVDKTLADDLRAEVRTLAERRPFGLNFERHVPESVDLPGRSVRRGDKVRMLPARDDPKATVSRHVWIVAAVTDRTADLVPAAPMTGERTTWSLADLVVVAEFRDRIYPGLVSTGSVRRGGETDPCHTVINSENFHALEALTYTHAGKIDAIYIDPPYNTGARDWKYGNDYVDREDAYRHSKWLAMMERRLRVAKLLLRRDNSVLIVAIDENETSRLDLLLQQTFPGSKVQMVTVLANPAGASIIDQFSRVDEQLYFVHVGSARPARTAIDTTPGKSSFVTEAGDAKPFRWPSFLRSGGNSRRQDTRAKFFAVYVHIDSERIVGCGDHLPEGVDRGEADAPPPGCVAVWPLKPNGSEACWQTSAPTFRQYLEDGRIRVGRVDPIGARAGISFLPKGVMRAISDGELVVQGHDHKGALIVENAVGRRRSQTGKTMWTGLQYSAREFGGRMLREFLPGRLFPFPKSLYAVEDALRYYVADKPNAVVLDFFSGSGTTAHAVMRLNKQDGGRRQCISVTNNEVSAEEAGRLRFAGHRAGDLEWERLGICDHITKPRIEAAITGRTPGGESIRGDYRFTDEFPMCDGFEANAEFFTLTYESPRQVAHHRAFERIAPLLWLRAGAVGRRIESAGDDFDVADTYAILFDLDAGRAFAEAVTRAVEVGADMRLAFVVTDDDRAYQAVCGDLPDQVEPVRLYSSYLTNVVLGGGR